MWNVILCWCISINIDILSVKIFIFYVFVQICGRHREIFTRLCAVIKTKCFCVFLTCLFKATIDQKNLLKNINLSKYQS